MSDWFPVPLSHPIPSPAILAEILDGGQSFAWDLVDEAVWRGQWLNYAFDLRWSPTDGLQARALTAEAHRTPSALFAYLGEGIDWALHWDQLPWRSDPVLQRAMNRFAGLRILHQPVEEVLLGFLCSSLKSIPQIKIILRQLAQKRGEKLPGSPRPSLPSWPLLAETEESLLRECGLGYRARHVANCARAIARHPGFFEDLKGAPFPPAREMLSHLPGVGPKIADCVCLFGLGHFEAFPIDSWIEKVLRAGYGLDDWTLPQCQHFAACHFGATAGLAQQFLFSAWRRGEKA